jgi:hypothetical protein
MKKIRWLGLILVLLLSAQAATAAILSPVRLVYASPEVGGDWHDADLTTDIRAHVDLMDGAAGSWAVSVRYHTNPGRPWLGPWPTMPMMLTENYDTHRVYRALIPDDGLCFEIIAVRTCWNPLTGRLTTETYRDNNNGAYYVISAFAGAPGTTAGAVGGNVGLVVASNYSRTAVSGSTLGLFNQYVAGRIVVPNVSASRVAGIRMSTDNWGTSTDVPIASWSVGSHGDEGLAWGRFLGVIGSRVTKPVRTVKFKVYYRDPITGQEFRDANFGQDYTVLAGETIR